MCYWFSLLSFHSHAIIIFIFLLQIFLIAKVILAKMVAHASMTMRTKNLSAPARLDMQDLLVNTVNEVV